MSPAISVEILDREGLVRHRQPWNDLVAAGLEANVFAEPDFLLSAARHLAQSPGPLFLVAWAKSRGGPAAMVGLCPVARSTGVAPLPARVWSHPQATAAFPLLGRDTASEALRALLSATGALPWRPAALMLSGVPLDRPTADVVRTAGVSFKAFDERTRAIIRRGSAVGLSAKARKELRRQWNRLAEQGAVTQSVSEPQALAAALDAFLELEAKGWKGKRGTALGQKISTRTFVREAVFGLAASGQARIDSLMVGNRPAAAGIVLRSGDRAFFWKTAFDEDLARFSPGLQLALHLTEEQRRISDLALTDSCAVPGHSMIDRLWPDRMPVADLLVATAADRPLALAVAQATETARRRLRAGAKVMLHRLARRR